MKYHGINYDTGTKTLTGMLTRETFDPGIVEKEMEIIRRELHCNAIRISGVDIGRIEKASELALKQGLTVWFSCSLQYDNQANTLEHIIQSAIVDWKKDRPVLKGDYTRDEAVQANYLLKRQ